jgi:triacylglycerol lipase
MATIVLCHGLMGYDELRLGPIRHTYWGGIDDALRAAGHHVVVTKTCPTGSIVRRARKLRDCIHRRLEDRPKNEKFILLGHSMGGLDARFLVSRMGFADRVDAVVTVSTPHHGSPFADFGVLHLDDRWGVLKYVTRLGVDVGAFRDLTTAACRQFNDDTPDAPGVAYYSVGCARPIHLIPPWSYLSHKVVYDREGDNDGLVSLKSAAWGTSLGTWNAHHWHAINRRFPDFGPAATGDITPHYVRLIEHVVDPRANAA